MGEGHRDDDPLAHPPAHLVRITGQAKLGVRDPDHAEELDRARHRRLLAQVGVGPDDLGDLVPDRRQGIEVLAGLRGGEGDLPPPNPLELPFAVLEKVRSPVRDPPAVDRERRVEQAEDRPDEHRLAGAGLADDPGGLPRLQLQGDPVQDLCPVTIGRERNVQVVDGEERGQPSTPAWSDRGIPSARRRRGRSRGWRSRARCPGRGLSTTDRSSCWGLRSRSSSPTPGWGRAPRRRRS